MAGILGLLMSGAGLIKDQYFNLTTLLLPGNGTNGAQNNTFLDSSTNNFTITRNGNTTQGTFSPFSQTGWGNYFDGSNDYLSISNQTALQLNGSQFTIEGWFYFTTSGVDNYIVIQSSGMTDSNVNWLVRVTSTNKLRVLLMTSGSTPVALDGSTTVTANSWHHFAATCDGTGAGSNVRSWLDGVYQGGTTVNPANINTNTASTQIGGWSFGSSYSPGYISNLRILKGTALYTGTANITVPTVPLTAITNTSLLTCQSNRFIDNSSNNFTITKNGDTSVVAFSPFAPTAAYTTAAVGGSGYFDGTGDYLTVPTSADFNLGTGAFTFETWVNPTASGAKGIFQGSSAGLIIQINASNKAVVRLYAVADLITSTDSIALNTWTHIAVARSGTTLSMWINGSRSAGGTVTDLSNFAQTGFVIGASETFANQFSGYMSNLRLVKGTAVYDPTQSSITVPTSPLTAVSGTSLLLNFTNAGITDATAKNDLETVGNAQISTTQSKWGGSSIFCNGNGNYLSIRATELLAMPGDFTVECWAYFTASSASDQFILSCDKNNYLQFGRTPAGKLSANQGGVGVLLTGATTLNNNTWYHLAMSRSGSTVRIFVNGTQDASKTYSTSITGLTNPIGIGALTTAPSVYFVTGYIQDLRFTQGYARYTANFTPPSAPFPVQ